LLFGITWANWQYGIEHPCALGFFPRWAATRTALVEGVSPYSVQANEAITEFATNYGCSTTQQFFYPYHSLAVFMPFAFIGDYALALGIWMTFLEVGLMLTAVSGLLLINWRPSIPLLGLYFGFSMGWYHGVAAVARGDVALLSATFFWVGIVFMKNNHDGAAGIFLALSTVKPQIVALALPLTLIWAFSKRRWNLIASVMSTLTALIGIAFLFDRMWLLQFLRQIVMHRTIFPLTTSKAIFVEWWPLFGEGLGWTLTVLVSVLLLIEWSRMLGKELRWFMWTLCLTLTVTSLLGIVSRPENYVVLLPALALVFLRWIRRFGLAGTWLMLATAILVGGGLWLLYLETSGVMGGVLLPGKPIMYLVFPLVLFVALYWVRWWTIHPQRMPIEIIKAMDEL
jgi:hypothetical protein